MMLVLGTVLMQGAVTRAPKRIEAILSLLLALPMIAIAPWPYKMPAVLMVIGGIAILAGLVILIFHLY